MTMFGKAGAAILNQLGVNLLGVDVQGQKRAQQHRALLQQAALQAAGLLNPAPGQIRQAQIGNDDGEDITAAFAPQMEQGPSRRRSPEEIASGLASLAAGVPGFNPKPYVDLAQYSRPNLTVTPSGEAIDQYDPSNAGRVFPKMGEGIAMGPRGAQDVPGYAESAARIAGATTRAQEGAKAGLDVISIKMPDGSEQQFPRDLAVQAILQSMMPGGGGGGFGRSQTPGDKVAQEGAARTGVERAAAQPQQFSGLTDQARATDLVIDTINRVLGEQLDPKTGKYAPKGGGMVSGWTTGLGANLAPIKGTPAHDLQAAMDTIKANIGLRCPSQDARQLADWRCSGQRSPKRRTRCCRPCSALSIPARALSSSRRTSSRSAISSRSCAPSARPSTTRPTPRSSAPAGPAPRPPHDRLPLAHHLGPVDGDLHARNPPRQAAHDRVRQPRERHAPGRSVGP
jgi:hypothetical protein